MKLGEKIRMLRNEKLMTQSELSGSEITRNMLSRIENGAAQPSLDTLRYLASKLNVCAGFLLAEGSEEQIYVKYNEMQGIKTAFLMGDYHICRDMCLNSTSSDDEIGLILAECTLEIAVEKFRGGELRSACEYFDKAIESCSETIYNTERVYAVAAMYFRYISRISATLASNVIDESEVPIWSSLSDPFCVYAYSFLKLCDDIPTSEKIQPAENSVYGLHVDAIKHMRAERYEESYELLHSILVGEESVPEPMMYFVFCDLEVVCRERGDYKGAYEYSINKMELLQKLLS